MNQCLHSRCPIPRQLRSIFPLAYKPWFFFISFHLDCDEVDAALPCKCACDHGFGTAWGSIHQKASWRLNPQTHERFGVSERPLDGLAQFVFQVCLPSDVRPTYLLKSPEHSFVVSDYCMCYRKKYHMLNFWELPTFQT